MRVCVRERDGVGERECMYGYIHMYPIPTSNLIHVRVTLRLLCLHASIVNLLLAKSSLSSISSQDLLFSFFLITFRVSLEV